MPQYIPEYPAPITMTLMGRKFSIGVSFSLKGDLSAPLKTPLLWRASVSSGRLGTADMMPREISQLRGNNYPKV